MNRIELTNELKAMQNKITEIRRSLWLRAKRKEKRRARKINQRRKFLERFGNSKSSK